MIIIDKTGVNQIKFPKNGRNFEDYFLTLEIRSELTGKEYFYDNLLDEGEDRNFYIVTLDLSDLEEGEYVYDITDGEWSTRGLLRIGWLDREVKSYENLETVKEYKYEE